MRIFKKSTLLALATFTMLSAFAFVDLKTELIRWESKTHDFGIIEKGKAVSQTFYFVNESQAAIIITKTKTSCGCTVSAHSKEEIAAGEKGFVKAEYNASRSGAFSKTISVYTSIDEAPILLKIKGEVK